MYFSQSLRRSFFFILLCCMSYYIIFIETEKYQSTSIVMIKDLSQEQAVSPLGALLSNSVSESMHDSKLFEIYIKSNEMYSILEKEFNLSNYYSSKKIDILHRLSNDSPLPFYKINKKNLLTMYNKDLFIYFDEPSGTIEIGFSHVYSKVAKKILERIVKEASKSLNNFEKQNIEIVLRFLKKQEREKYGLFMTSLNKLLHYQTEHNTMDPKIDFELKRTIFSKLESELVQKEVDYNTKLQYLNPKSSEMKLLKGNIQLIRQRSSKIKNELTGKTNKKELNVDISNFELLKNSVEFNKELYRQTLSKLEETKVLVKQNVKNLIVISRAEIADSYSSPNKIKNIFSLFIVLSFLYGILILIFNIIQDHKD